MLLVTTNCRQQLLLIINGDYKLSPKNHTPITKQQGAIIMMTENSIPTIRINHNCELNCENCKYYDSELDDCYHNYLFYELREGNQI